MNANEREFGSLLKIFVFKIWKNIFDVVMLWILPAFQILSGVVVVVVVVVVRVFGLLWCVVIAVLGFRFTVVGCLL